MNTGYCGKNCEKCREENNHDCGGYKGGKAFRKGDCKIVDCVTSKKLCSCNECSVRLSCSMIQNNTKLYGLERGKSSENEPVIKKGRGKWFTVLFVSTLIDIICTVLELDFLKTTLGIPDFISIGFSVVSLILFLIACYFLYQFSDDFKKSAISCIGYFVLSIVYIIIIANETDGIIKFIAFILSTVILILTIMYNCYLFSGCSEATRNIDRHLSEQWENLKKYLVISIISLIGSGFVALLGIPLIIWLALIAVLISSIAIIIVKITSLVLSYQTMKCCNAIDKE